MKKYIAFKKEKRFLFHFIISYSILLVIILVMGLYLYHLGIDDARFHLYKQSQSGLAQAVSEMDTSFRIIHTLCTQISSDSNIQKLLRESSTTPALTDFYGSAFDAMKYLTSLLPSEQILPISDYYVYLKSTGYLLSSSFLNDTDLYYHMAKHYPKDFYQDWLQLLEDTDNYYQLLSLQKFEQKESSSFLYKVPVSAYTIFRSSPGTICFEIDEEKIYQIFSNLALFETGFLYVTDQNNQKIFDIRAEHTPASITLSESMDSNSPFTYQSTYNTIDKEYNTYITYTAETVDRKPMVVTAITSPYNGWNYYLVQPSSMAFKRLLTYQRTYAFIIIFACLLSFMLILFLSKRNVKPILKIHNELEDSLLEKSYLQETLEAQKPIIYHSYLARIMTGRVNSAEEMAQIADYLKICTQNRKFCVLYITVHYDAENVLQILEQQNSYHSIDELLSEKFCEYFGNDILIYEAGSFEYALLLHNPYDETLENFGGFLKNSFIELHKNLSMNYSIWILGGLGNRNSELFYTWKSYQQAAEAVTYTGKDHPFQVYIELTKTNTSYYYPNELIEKLTNFITTSNQKQVKELFKLIYHENYKERSLPLHMQKWFLSDLRNTLLKIRFSIATTQKNESSLASLDELILSKASNFDSIQEIALQLTALFESKPEGNKLILRIQTYIKENYADSSLCLAKISDTFNISESYFSYLFKAETKENFSEYLERIRMEQAMHLLKTTTISISNLYLEVGYNNANSFRRAFKKVHGISPRQARENANKAI